MRSSLHPSLSRQLKRVGITQEDDVPDVESWKKFLRSINEHYRYVEEDRELLARTSELAAEEVNQIKTRMVGQEHVLRTTLSTIAGTLGELGKMASTPPASHRSSSEPPPPEVLTFDQAKEKTTQQFEELFAKDVLTADSTGELSGVKANLVNLADELGRLLHQVTEKAKVQRELDAARAFQTVFLPGLAPIDFPYVQIAGASHPMHECGGDFWGVHALTGDRVLVLVGDVTGHGIVAAIVAGAAKAASSLMTQMTKGELDARQALQHLNSTIYDVAKKQVMMTCAAGVIDPNRRTLALANAGHHFAYLVRDGVGRPLIAQGPPLGAGPTAEYDPVEFPLEPNDTLVWFTDGAIETENEWGEQYTEKRLRAVCQRLAKEGAAPCRDGILDVLKSFRGEHPQNDDVTIVVATIKI
jgi:phosphoserine phosphatase RsbU/P